MADSSALPQSVISHVSLGTNDYPRAKAFYDALLPTLQIRLVMDFPGGAGYGRTRARSRWQQDRGDADG